MSDQNQHMHLFFLMGQIPARLLDIASSSASPTLRTHARLCLRNLRFIASWIPSQTELRASLSIFAISAEQVASAVADAMVDARMIGPQLVRIGFPPDEYSVIAAPYYLYQHYGLDADGVAERVRKTLR